MSDPVAEALAKAVDAARGATDANGCVPPSMEDRVAAAVGAFLSHMEDEERVLLGAARVAKLPGVAHDATAVLAWLMQTRAAVECGAA